MELKSKVKHASLAVFSTVSADRSAKMHTNQATKNWSCKQSSKCKVGKDKLVKKVVSKYSDEFKSLAKSFGLSAYQFEKQLAVQQGINKLAVKFNH
jgi:hypothetical protein